MTIEEKIQMIVVARDEHRAAQTDAQKQMTLEHYRNLVDQFFQNQSVTVQAIYLDMLLECIANTEWEKV
jgi:hypothetical protein